MKHDKLFQTIVVTGMSLASAASATGIAGCECATPPGVDAGRDTGTDTGFPREGPDGAMPLDAPRDTGFPMEGIDVGPPDVPIDTGFPMEGPIMLDTGTEDSGTPS